MSHDTRGNTSAIGSASYGYTAENHLASSGSGTFAHDPLGRLVRSSASTTDFVRGLDGQVLVERTTGGGAKAYHVAGEGANELLYSYDSAGGSDLLTDERGSVIARTNSAGNLVGINRYDEYGQPQGGSLTGRFGYTGQAWLPELGMYDYHARVYNPSMGRFMQSDPIGYAAGMNFYSYVGNDPVNYTDLLGLLPFCRSRDASFTQPNGDIVVQSQVTCEDDGLSLSDVEGQIADWMGIHSTLPGDEVLFSVIGLDVLRVTPGSRTTCQGSPVVSYSTSRAAFGGGITGHVHTADFLPGIGPDDGVAARNGGGVTYVGGTAGSYRVQRFGATDYGVTLLRGDWGISQSELMAQIEKWNRYDGQNGPRLESQGGSQSHAQCTTTRISR